MLRACVESVLKQTFDAIEVIVVDNNSADGTKEMLKESFPGVRLIENRKNHGPSRSRNQAIRDSSGSFIWFLDSDILVPDRDCLSFMVSVLEKCGDVGAIGGELTKDNQGNITILDKKILLNGDTKTTPLSPDDCVMRETGYISTCNCLTRTSLLKAIGGFDPEYFFLSEDVELGYQIRKKGYRNIIDSRSAVFHIMARRSRTSTLFLKYRNNLRFALKNRPLYILPALPFLDIYYLFSSNKFSMAMGHGEMIRKYIPDARSGNSYEKTILILKAFSLFFLSMAAAYIWNLRYLHRTIKTRIRKPNYLIEEGLTVIL